MMILFGLRLSLGFSLNMRVSLFGCESPRRSERGFVGRLSYEVLAGLSIANVVRG